MKCCLGISTHYIGNARCTICPCAWDIKSQNHLQSKETELALHERLLLYVLVIKGYCHRFNYVKESILVLCFLGTKLSHGCQVAQKGKRVNSTSGSLPACIDMLKPSEKLCNMRRNRIFIFSQTSSS